MEPGSAVPPPRAGGAAGSRLSDPETRDDGAGAGGGAGQGGVASPPGSAGSANAGGAAGAFDGEDGVAAECCGCGSYIARGRAICESAVPLVRGVVACGATPCEACTRRIVAGVVLGEDCLSCLREACPVEMAICEGDRP